jgi:hypothetical protein
MRWINRDKYTPTNTWLKKANAVTNSLISATSKAERKKIIEENSNLWREIKDELFDLSHGKCWYSEAKRTVSFFDVDHFRPKNNVKALNWDGFETSNIDEGYWWLAFDWKNYRPAGEIINRKNSDENGVCRGKQDYFPLVKGCQCAATPNDNIENEIPIILDPTVLEDSIIISFDMNGEVIPAVPNDTFEYYRAKVTIKLLHLDNPLLTDARLHVWNYCKRLLDEIEKIILKRDAVSPLIEEIKRDKLAELAELLSPKSEFSSVATACILQSKHLWAKNLLKFSA